MSLREIVRPVPSDNRPYGEPCPRCNVPTRVQQVACPDGREGCLVLHYGWHCDRCGRDYQ